MNRKSIAIRSALIASLFAVGLAAPALAQRAGWSTDASVTFIAQARGEATQGPYDGNRTRRDARAATAERNLFSRYGMMSGYGSSGSYGIMMNGYGPNGTAGGYRHFGMMNGGNGGYGGRGR